MPEMIVLTNLKGDVSPEVYEVSQIMTERYAQNT
jgi:hypothetical protein